MNMYIFFYLRLSSSVLDAMRRERFHSQNWYRLCKLLFPVMLDDGLC